MAVSTSDVLLTSLVFTCHPQTWILCLKKLILCCGRGPDARAFPRKHEGPPVVMSFQYAGRQFDTKSGLKAGTGTTNFYRSAAFKNAKSAPFSATSPVDIVLGYDVPQQMYCHLLCGLYRCQEVEQMSAIFAYMIVEPFRLLERVWRDICKDIREGTVNERVSDPELRSSVLKVLSPNPELADLIERECAKGWSGIIERLFPNINYIMSIFSGSMLPYVAPMRQYAGSVPLMNADYGASEAWIGINLDPRCPAEDASFTIIPNFAYFEFIPVNRDSAGYDSVEGDEIVGLTDVKVGQEYEIVLTTVGGLYRYRLGDIVKVTGFFNSTPKVAFVCRKGVVLSVNTDKTDEEELRLVVGKASLLLKESNMELADYSSYTDQDSQPGHYVIFWELRSHEHLDMDLLSECCKVLDQSFNNPYMRGRAARTIGPLELAIVKEGAFARLMEQFVRKNGVGASQYKVSRCFKNPATLKHFRDETIATLRSPDFPPELLAAWRPSTKIVG